MSVINDMLRDLETRTAPERQAPAGLPRSLVAQKSQKSKWLLSLFVLIVLVLATSLWVLFKENGALRNGIKVDAIERLPSSAAISESAPGIESVQEDAESLEPKSIARVELSGKVMVQNQQANDTRAVAETTVSVISADHARANKTAQGAAEETPAIPAESLTKGTLAEAKTVSRESAEARQASVLSPSIDKTTVTKEPKEPEAEAAFEPKSAGVILTPKAKDQANALQAADALKKGYAQEVIDSLYRFISENEVNSLSRVVLARQMLARQRLAEVGELLATVDASSIVALREIKARWYAAQGRLEAALVTLNSALPPVGESPEYYALMASYYQQEGQFAEAVDTYSLLLEQNSDIADWWVGMAIGLDQMQRYNDAVLAYRQALALPNLKSSLASFSQSRLQQLTL